MDHLALFQELLHARLRDAFLAYCCYHYCVYRDIVIAYVVVHLFVCMCMFSLFVFYIGYMLVIVVVLMLYARLRDALRHRALDALGLAADLLRVGLRQHGHLSCCY